jgi:aldehyde dehydrogenase (NAD+)
LGIKDVNEGTSTGLNGEILESYSPVDGQLIAKLKQPLLLIMKSNGISNCCFQNFRTMPAPQRGEIVRQFGEKLRKIKKL